MAAVRNLALRYPLTAGVENHVEQLAALGLTGFAFIGAAGHDHGARDQYFSQFAAPELPVYEQPAIPADGYLFTPGYWAWVDRDQGYYWVPGTWVLAPQPGYLWTPGYWGGNGGVFSWNEGYWGTQVGFGMVA